MRRAAELDWKTVPLQGTRLVEAGAGTGKTHAIIRLYLRLLLEQGLPVDRILVLTFTRAGTAELQDRIYRSLSALHRALRSADGPADEADRFLLQGAHAARRIDAALECFEEAAIFTIHGLCRRLLSEQAFECGLSFGAEFDPDADTWLSLLARDHWRRRVCRGGALYAGLAMRHFRGGPEDLCTRFLADPALRLHVPPAVASLPALRELDGEYRQAFAQAARCWRAERAVIRECIERSDALNRRSYRIESLPDWFAELDRCFGARDEPTLGLPDALHRFTPQGLTAATRKGCDTPRHAFFHACDRLQSLREQYRLHLVRLRQEFLDGARAEAMERSRRSGRLGYDELLYEMHRALSDAPDSLRDCLQKLFRAVLVDEFQDTDGLQYRILRALCGEGQPLLLVGDPKQAIYNFRGADLYTYLAARRGVDSGRRYTLTGNRRSVSGLIDACNALFSGSAYPFLEESIPFLAAHPASPPAATLRVQGAQGASDAPMVLWWHDDPEADVRGFERRAAVATAAEIAGLLLPEGGAVLDGQPLSGADVAVLVRTRGQGRLMHRALSEAGVNSVFYGADSVFAGRMAEELWRLLAAVVEPHREERVRSALGTLLLGVDAAELQRADGAWWDRRLRDFHHWRGLWERHGFMPMFRQLLVTAGVEPRLAVGAEGARDIADLRHLAELLQAQERGHRASIEAVLRWFGLRLRLCRRAAATGAPAVREEEQPCLESDGRLVRITTIHRSKGLEYEVVFCPFAWKGLPHRRQGDREVYCHDPEHGALLALGGEGVDPLWERWRRRRQFESLAEELRLLYVALTRARQRCYLVWGRARLPRESGLAWLLHSPADAAQTEALQCASRLSRLAPADFLADLERFAARAGGGVRLAPLPLPSVSSPLPPASPASAARLARRQCAAAIPPPLGVTSYSALVRGSGAEQPDYDAGTVPAPGAGHPDPAPGAPDGAPENDIHALPPGARTGRCLHAILEHMDFVRAGRDPRGLAERVAETLSRYGFPAERWTPAVVRMIHALLDADLDADVCLRELSAGACCREMEFYFRLRGLSAQGLHRVLDAHRAGATDAGAGAAGRFAFESLDGAMKGFIDLVFEAGGRYYIVDYKSNRLGDTGDAYTDARIGEAMSHEGYVLQYLIYTVALHRYLRGCLPAYRYQEHFGGVRYLFLRGLWGGSARGVFRCRPSAALVDELDAYFDAVEAAA